MPRIDYQLELNAEQLDVVQNADGPCLVLAGAGSGKTRTITYRVARLIESGVDPSRILLVTFTNKAAKEMMARVASLFGAEVSRVWGGTFHSIANRIIRANANRLGFSSRYTILDQDDAESLLKAVMKELAIDPKARRFPTAAVTQNILSFAQNTISTVAETLELTHPHFVPLAGDIEEIGRLYQERKRQANAMDFDDLLKNWLVLMADPTVGDGIARQFQYVLVDEYQDTNALQAAIVKAAASHHRNLLVVGDDAQSIYAFRGADVRNILAFPKEWPDARIFKLLTNYRSTPDILDLANDSLSHNERQFQKELVAVRDRGKKPVVVPFSSARQEADFVASKIETLRHDGVPSREIAVLFRSSAHSQALEFELLKRNVEYEYRGGMKFFARAHVKDALAYLRVIENVKDEAAWIRCLNHHPGIGAVTAIQVARSVQKMPEVESVLASDIGIRLPPRSRAGWEACASLLSRVLAERPSPAFMLRVLITSWYRDYLEREYPDWKDRQEDLEQLASFAETYPDAASFLADIALYDDVISGNSQKSESLKVESQGRVILSTIHQAKGLEWDTVFLIHLSENNFPHRRAMGEEGGLEEERRLFYVAVTRARRSLFLTYPVTSGYDTLSYNQPSLFLEELSPHLVERLEGRESIVESRQHLATHDSRRSDDWNWEEPTIEIDRSGEQKKQPDPASSVWKTSKKSDISSRTSFLRDVQDL